MSGTRDCTQALTQWWLTHRARGGDVSRRGDQARQVRGARGDDGGCFEAALASVRMWGGVLEHPKDSKAWAAFGLKKPPHRGWEWAGAGSSAGPAWTCCVSQGHYGHFSNKPTWLYVVGPRPDDLIWGKGPNVLPLSMVERYGYEKARRIGVMAMVGGKDKTRIREATPPAFRDVLLALARAARAP